MSQQILDRLARLERDHRRLQAFTLALLAMLAVLAISAWPGETALAQGADTPRELTVSQLNVVDGNGVARVRIGADLPDGVIQGRTVRRGHAFAGVLLYDDDGQERSGYGTMGEGNVALTLDTREFQSASFAAGPTRGAALRLWDGDDSIDLRVDENGPSLHASAEGAVAFHEPVIDDPANAPFCRSYRELAERYSVEDIWKACRKRRAEASCQACLGPLQ